MGKVGFGPSQGSVVSSFASEWVKLGLFQVSGAGSFGVSRVKLGFV